MRVPTELEIRQTIKKVFPLKGSTYRPGQEDAVYRIVSAFFAGKKYFILEAPTGAGKSLLGYTAAMTIKALAGDFLDKRPMGPYTLMAVQTRALQKQYGDSFDNLPVLWSGRNYPCNIEPDNKDMFYGCGQCLKTRCYAFTDCHYQQAVDAFKYADVGVTNYAYYLHAAHFGSVLSVIDECHNLEESLCEWAKVELSPRYLNLFLPQLVMSKLIETEDMNAILDGVNNIIAVDDMKEGWLEQVREFARPLVIEVNSIASQLEDYNEEQLTKYDHPKQIPQSVREKFTLYERMGTYFKNLAQKLILVTSLKSDWVISSRGYEEVGGGKKKGRRYPKATLKPLNISELAEQRFFRRSQFTLMMSATVCGPDVMASYLGLKPEDGDYLQLPSYFPVENRQVYAFKQLGELKQATREYLLPQFVKYIDIVLSGQLKGVRGIIHSVSYENAEYIKSTSQHTSRMRFPKSSDLLEIAALLQEDKDIVVVSPSVVEGIDLKDDLCRFAIFLKVPWASLGDKWIKARSKDSAWYARNTIIKLVQGSGRGTRSKDDYSVTLILDAMFLRLWNQNREFFPEWFQDAVQFVDIQ